MNQFVGPNAQVVLSLKEGKGFDKITNPTCIVATLNGLSLETHLINPDPNPQNITDLVWEAHKSALRKMRSAQEPLKIECFEIKENGIRDRIGYLLLSMRTAQIITRKNEQNLKVNWHKLLGLRNDIKADRPEFYISFSIEERNQFLGAIPSKRDLTVINKASVEKILNPHLIDEEHLIQLGPVDTCKEIFLLHIIVEKVGNLHQLLIKSDGYKSYSFWYYIFDNEVQSKSFTYHSQSRALDEQIIIRIRTRLDVLKNYFKSQPTCLVVLKCGNHVVGQHEVDLKSLVPTDNIDDFLLNSNCGIIVLNEHCIFKIRNDPDNALDPKDKPYFDITIKLQYTGMKNFNDNLQADSVSEIYRKQSRHDHPCIHNKGLGDVMKKTVEVEVHREADSHKCSEQSENLSEHSHICHKHDNSKNAGVYRCYCLNITLNSMKLKSLASIKNIEFKFHHPKAEVMSTLHSKMPVMVGEKLKLKDISCKLHFISSAEEIRHSLLRFPPRVSVYDGDQSDKSCLGQLVLDAGQVYDGPNLECQYEAPLIDGNQQEIGSIEVKMNLKDQGPYYRSKKWLDGNMGPPILDDSLAYKIVEELETWKERQQELFRIELKRKEERHLNRLSKEWQIRRESLESKFNCGIEQCKLLANNLAAATDDLRSRRLQSLEKEARSIKINEELKWSYDRKLQELEDASQRMQQDFASKIPLLEDQKKNSEMQVEILKNDIRRLETIVKKQNEELATYNKGTLMQSQVEDLEQKVKTLESKLDTAQKNKAFFKEQWGKAVREIHKMKMEHQLAIELQIQSNREKLKNIDLEQLLRMDSAALSNDKILLEQIQKEIDVIRPTPSFTLNTQQESICPSNYNSVPRSLAHCEPTIFSLSNEQDQRLRKLIEERDSLLKTGNYIVDDEIIVKLNTEIRSMLISN